MVLHIARLTLEAQLCYLVVATVLSIFCTFFGYLVWKKQGYYKPKTGGRRTAGFTPSGIAGIAGYFTFAGLSVALLVECSFFYVRYAFHPTHKGRYWVMHRYASVIFQFLLGGTFLSTAIAVLVRWGGGPARCGFLFCLNSTKYKSPGNTRGQNFDILMSFIIFVVLAPAGLVLWARVVSTVLLRRAASAVRTRDAKEEAIGESSAGGEDASSGSGRGGASAGAKAKVVATEANPLAKPVSMRPFHGKPKVKQACRLIGVCLGILVYATASFWLPNEYRKFNANAIATFASGQLSRTTRTSGYTMPEMGDAYFFTHQIVISKNLVLKLFPGNVFFYVYLLVTALLVFALRLTQTSRYWAQRRIPFCGSFTFGEALFVLATTALSVGFFIYWLHDHNYKQTWSVTAKASSQIEAPERWGRGLGQLAILFLSLLLLPVGRQSVVVSVLGVSRDGLLWFHRAIGYAMLAATFAHIVAFYVSYHSFGYLLRNLNTVNNKVCKKGVFDDFTVLTATWTTWFLFISMGIFGLNYMRRRYYELFYYTHLAATYSTVPMMLFHAAAGWMYLLPGMTLLVADQMVRIWQRSAVVKVVRARVISEDTTELAFSLPGRRDMRHVYPGQYVLLCVPELSALQWHPFTLTNVIDEESLAKDADAKVTATGTVFYVHIKSMGPKTWTGRLYDVVRSGEEITMAVEGPVGTPVDYRHYDDIVLVGGGIGVAPCVSVFGSLLREYQAASPDVVCPRVHCIWTTRSGRHVNAVADLLQLPVRCGDIVRLPGTSNPPVDEITADIVHGKALEKPKCASGDVQPETFAGRGEPMNGEVSAFVEVGTATEEPQRFSFEVYVTRDGELRHFLGGDRYAPEELNRDDVAKAVAMPTGTLDLDDGLRPEANRHHEPSVAASFGDGGGGEEMHTMQRPAIEMGSEYSGPVDNVDTEVVAPAGWSREEASLNGQCLTCKGDSTQVKSLKRPSHCSSNGSGNTAGVALEVHTGRPDVEKQIREVLGCLNGGANKMDKARTMLFACGPNALVRQVIATGAQLGVAVHKEEFLF